MLTFVYMSTVAKHLEVGFSIHVPRIFKDVYSFSLYFLIIQAVDINAWLCCSPPPYLA